MATAVATSVVIIRPVVFANRTFQFHSRGIVLRVRGYRSEQGRDRGSDTLFNIDTTTRVVNVEDWNRFQIGRAHV